MTAHDDPGPDELSVDAALDALRRVPPPPPAEGAIDRAVLRAVRARSYPPEPRRSRWRLAPLVLAAAAVTLFGLWTSSRGSMSAPFGETEDSRQVVAEATSAVEAAADGDADAEEWVRFVLPAPGASQVAVAGDFNGWDPSEHVLEDPDADGVFHATLPLPTGTHAYMFVVDGERWVTDPFAGAYRDDGFGGRNAIVHVR